MLVSHRTHISVNPALQLLYKHERGQGEIFHFLSFDNHVNSLQVQLRCVSKTSH